MIRILILIFLSLGMWSCRHAPDEVKGPPNVLMIVVDDLNDWITLFDPANPIRTPNLIKLANRGVFFNRAYSSSPACNPSRASVLSGLRPSRTGVYGNASDWRSATAGRPTLQSHFKNHGYYVAGAGKIFHHHKDWAFHDNASFNEYLMMSINEPYPPHKLNGLDDYGTRNTDWGMWPEHIEETADYRTMKYAVDFLEKEHRDPFFLNVGIYKPHSPFFAPADYFDPYPLETITMPNTLSDDMDDLPQGARTLLEPSDWFWTGMQKALKIKPESWRTYVQAYQACASFADDMIGRVIDALDQSAYKDNTIIVLWSDHGFHLGEKEHFEKFALWEKTNHVPFIIIAPGVTDPGTIEKVPVDLSVIYPTLSELCGLPVPDVDGTSLVPLLQHNSQQLKPALSTYGKGNHALRTDRWRYIHYADGSEELYDHDSDPNEYSNLAHLPDFRKLMDSLAQFLPVHEVDQVPDL